MDTQDTKFQKIGIPWLQPLEKRLLRTRRTPNSDFKFEANMISIALYKTIQMKIDSWNRRAVAPIKIPASYI